MPKSAEYRVEWSSTLDGYEIIHTPFSFSLTSASWSAWLDMIETFHFCSPTCDTLTLRKEKKQRGSAYWYAYKRVDGKVQKKYLGDKSKLDLDMLETLAYQFARSEPVRPQLPPPPPPPQPTLKFTKSLESALHIYGFSAIPDRKTLIIRYRELSKKYHPDTGGLHLDMVAVNLAYDYLKVLVHDRW
jgi:LuxR family maltose regulon positive regulatory protein